MQQVIVVDHNEQRREQIIAQLKTKSAGIEWVDFHQVEDITAASTDGLYVMHQGNNNMWTDIEQLIKAGRNVGVVYTGGSFKSNLRRYRSIYSGTRWDEASSEHDLKTPLYVDYVGQGSVSKLASAILFLLQGKQAAVLVLSSAYQLSRFDIRRRDLSHDHFKNGFSNALGFDASNRNSERRFELFRRAAKERETWLKMKRVTCRWPELAQKLQSLIIDVGSEALFACPTEQYHQLQADAQQSIEQVDVLMAKFSGEFYQQAVLSEGEIMTFWQAIDVLNQWLQALDVASDGMADAAYFVASTLTAGT